MKKIALFGGSGKTGRLALEKALAKGYAVNVLVREKNRIAAQHQNLTIIEGDVLNLKAVEATIMGTDVVVSLFGHVKNSPEWLQTNGTKNITQAMKQLNVAKIISLSGGGLPFEKDEPKFADKAIRTIMKLAVPKILNDAIAHANHLQTTSLDWIIVRGPRLTDGPNKGKYRIGWVGVNSSTSIGRSDLADFILTQIEDRQFIKQMPFVSY